MTSFAMFYRPDFMSMTAVSLGIYAVTNPNVFKRKTFRMLVAFMMISFIYDIVFLIFVHDSDADDEADSHMAINVRRFARFERGEGIEKKEENFAEEVMKQIK